MYGRFLPVRTSFFCLIVLPGAGQEHAPALPSRRRHDDELGDDGIGRVLSAKRRRCGKKQKRMSDGLEKHDRLRLR